MDLISRLLIPQGCSAKPAKPWPNLPLVLLDQSVQLITFCFVIGSAGRTIWPLLCIASLQKQTLFLNVNVYFFNLKNEISHINPLWLLAELQLAAFPPSTAARQISD